MVAYKLIHKGDLMTSRLIGGYLLLRLGSHIINNVTGIIVTLSNDTGGADTQYVVMQPPILPLAVINSYDTCKRTKNLYVPALPRVFAYKQITPMDGSGTIAHWYMGITCILTLGPWRP